MKKLIALSISFILAATSCSSKTTAPEPVFTEDGKAVVTVGSFGIKDPLMDDEKRIPEGIEVQYIDFCEGAELSADDFDKQLKALQMELDRAVAKGEVPDVLLISAVDVKRLDRIGALADLSALMDEYDGIKRDELTDAALEGLTIDGHIPALMKTYSVYAPVVKSKFVPQEYDNWTIGDAMRFYGELPDNMTFCGGTDMTEYLIKHEGLNCVDENSGTCDFSGKFAEILQFCRDNSGYSEQYIEETEAGHLQDRSLVYFIHWNDSIPQSIYTSFAGQDVTFVGYPSEDGCGAEVNCNDPYLYCISEQCSNKEAAWRLLCEMVRTNYDYGGRATDSPREISIFRKWIKDDHDKFIAEIDPNMPEEEIVTREYFDRVSSFYNSVPANIYRNYELSYLIMDECMPAVKGERSVEEAIKILNDRVGTYLSERT